MRLQVTVVASKKSASITEESRFACCLLNIAGRVILEMPENSIGEVTHEVGVAAVVIFLVAPDAFSAASAAVDGVDGVGGTVMEGVLEMLGPQDVTEEPGGSLLEDWPGESSASYLRRL